MVGMGLNIGGFGTKACFQLGPDKCFLQIGQDICILPPIKNIATKAESSHNLVLTRMLLPKLNCRSSNPSSNSENRKR